MRNPDIDLQMDWDIVSEGGHINSFVKKFYEMLKLVNSIRYVIDVFEISARDSDETVSVINKDITSNPTFSSLQQI